MILIASPQVLFFFLTHFYGFFIDFSSLSYMVFIDSCDKTCLMFVCSDDLKAGGNFCLDSLVVFKNVMRFEGLSTLY